MNKILIIGGGISGLNAAKAARDASPDCEITLIEAEKNNTYIRTRLPEFISEEIDKEALFPYGDTWYEENNIRYIKDCTITEMDYTGKMALTQADRISYDALIIASGSSPFVPGIPGGDKLNVLSVRTIADSEMVKELAKSSSVCTIIGGGLLGLEMAWSVRQLGCSVNIVEFAPRLLPRQIDEQASELLLEALMEKGINIYLDSQTEEFVGSGKVSGVKLKSGTVIETDFVILSTGVRANVASFKKDELTVNKAIVVDGFCQTSVAGVFAAGDAAEYNGNNFCIWPIAISQGRVAGHNAARYIEKNADLLKYTEQQPFTNLKIKGITMFSIGDISAKDCEALVYTDKQSKKYIKLFIKDSNIKAAIVFGEPSITLTIKKAVDMQKHIPHYDSTISVYDLIKSL